MAFLEVPRLTFPIDSFNILKTSRQGQPLLRTKQLNFQCVLYSEAPLYHKYTHVHVQCMHNKSYVE